MAPRNGSRPVRASYSMMPTLYQSPAEKVARLRTVDSVYFSSPDISRAPKRNGGPLSSVTLKRAERVSGSIAASLVTIRAAAYRSAARLRTAAALAASHADCRKIAPSGNRHPVLSSAIARAASGASASSAPVMSRFTAVTRVGSPGSMLIFTVGGAASRSSSASMVAEK